MSFFQALSHAKSGFSGGGHSRSVISTCHSAAWSWLAAGGFFPTAISATYALFLAFLQLKVGWSRDPSE